jgi:DNA replication protein DnaC
VETIENVLQAMRAPLSPAGPAEASRCTSRDSEPVCSTCGGTGWRRSERNSFIGFRRCECVRAGFLAARLALIPEMFREASFESYCPKNPRQERTLAFLRRAPDASFYLTGAYGSGKTHMLYAQYRAVAHAGRTRCHVRTSRELVEELKRAELEDEFVSPVMAAASASASYHLFWDDIDKLKPTEFKTEVLFELVDKLYRQKHRLTVTGNYSLRELVERERLHPAIVRRLDDMCRAVEL